MPGVRQAVRCCGAGVVAMEATGHYWRNLFAALAAPGYAWRSSTRCAPGASRRGSRPHQDRCDRCAGHRPFRRPEAPCRDRLAKPPPTSCVNWCGIATGSAGLRRPGPSAPPPRRSRLPRVHPLRQNARQRAGHDDPGRVPERQAFAEHLAASAGPDGLRRPPQRRRELARPDRGRQGLGRPAPRPAYRDPGPSHLRGPGPLAPAAPRRRRDQRHSTNTRSAAADHDRRHRPQHRRAIHR